MMESNIKVTGEYLSYDTYVLKEGGEIIRTIKCGESFTIGRMLWRVEKEIKKNGKGTCLVCKHFDSTGVLKKQYYLPHKKTLLWALTEEEAQEYLFRVDYEGMEQMGKLENFLKARKMPVELIEMVKDVNLYVQLFGVLKFKTDGENYKIVYRECKQKDDSVYYFIDVIYVTSNSDVNTVIEAIRELKRKNLKKKK